jgi:anti-sigma factor RsiW
MRHLTDGEIVRLIARELPRADAESAQSHIGSCPACAARVREQGRIWSALGAWEATSQAPDVTAAVFSRIDGESAGRSFERLPFPRRRIRWARAGRLAASVLIAAGVGHAIGRWTSGVSEAGKATRAPVTTAEVVDSLGLDALASAPVGLADAIDGAGDDADMPGGQS